MDSLKKRKTNRRTLYTRKVIKEALLELLNEKNLIKYLYPNYANRLKSPEPLFILIIIIFLKFLTHSLMTHLK